MTLRIAKCNNLHMARPYTNPLHMYAADPSYGSWYELSKNMADVQRNMYTAYYRIYIGDSLVFTSEMFEISFEKVDTSPSAYQDWVRKMHEEAYAKTKEFDTVMGML